MILISTGDIREPYEILDAIFAVDGSTESFFSELNPDEAFEDVKQQLRERCHRLGGHAVINCHFEYRNALADGFLGKKQALEIFGYGTAIRFLDPVVAAEVETGREPWEDRARALVAHGDKIEATKLIREKTGCGLKEAVDLISRWQNR